MKIPKILVLLAAAATMHTAVGQTNQDVFRVHFRAKCTPSDSNGNGRNSTTMTERDLIAQCAGNGFTANQLNRNFALVYNPASDSIQVVNAQDGSRLCDVFLFQPGTNVQVGNLLERFVFVFSPDDTNSIGTAVITERTADNGNGPARINLTGKIQFTSPAATSSNMAASATAFQAPTFSTGTGNANGTGTSGSIGASGSIGNNSANGNVSGSGNTTGTANVSGNGTATGNGNSRVLASSTVDTNQTSSSTNLGGLGGTNTTSNGAQICIGTFTAGRLFVSGNNVAAQASARRANSAAKAAASTSTSSSTRGQSGVATGTGTTSLSGTNMTTGVPGINGTTGINGTNGITGIVVTTNSTTVTGTNSFTTTTNQITGVTPIIPTP